MNEPLTANQLTPTWTEEEIRQQPDCWIESLKNIAAQRNKLDAFLQPILALDNIRVVLTGAGTSSFIGEIIAPWLSQHTKIDFVAIPTTDIVTNPLEYLPTQHPVLLISFARSGNSPESVAAVDLANQCIARCYHLVITCNENGSLYQSAIKNQNAFALLMPAQTNDRGFAMTSSISTMMSSCLAVFAPTQFNHQRFNRVADRCREIIRQQADFSQSVFEDLAYKRVVYLGSGGLQGLARESALKILELTAGQLASFYDTPTGFRHGPKSLVDNETLVVMFVSNHSYTRQYDLDLLAELRRDRIAMRVIAISEQPADIISAGPHIYLPQIALPQIALPQTQLSQTSITDLFNDLELTFCFLIYAQLFALSESFKAGITPDTPSASGTVNRVVKGVVIHPWDSEQEGA